MCVSWSVPCCHREAGRRVVPSVSCPQYLEPARRRLSVDAVHVSAIVVDVCEGEVRLVGAVGGVVSTEVDVVVTVTALLAAETLPAASTATTV